MVFSVQGRASDNSPVDFGIRMAVEDEKAASSDREIVVRELPSLAANGHAVPIVWDEVKVDLGEFTLRPYRKPLGDADPNRVNKLVFFVDNYTVDRYPAGEVWIKGISLERRCGLE